jgi:hypothetical protein
MVVHGHFISIIIGKKIIPHVPVLEAVMEHKPGLWSVSLN